MTTATAGHCLCGDVHYRADGPIADGMDLAGVWFADNIQGHNVLPSAVPHFSGNDSGA